MRAPPSADIDLAPHPLAGEVLTPEAISFVTDLERAFGPRRRALLAARRTRQQAIDAGERPAFAGPAHLARGTSWQVAPVPTDLADRRVEITGPVERKMMITALNSGASVFMADFEDATAPTWDNIVTGQRNVRDALAGTIAVERDGRVHRLGDQVATLMVRPRGWHLDERHLRIGDAPASAALVDAGLALAHGAHLALERGTGPYFYLPKLQGHLEARLWNDVFAFAEERLGLPPACIKATVLIETIHAAFEMDEILYELRDRSAGLNAGRWDYIFSVIKTFRDDPRFVLPDRAQVTMAVPFMRAYTELLVATCHRRGAHAIGGMSAFIPNRRRPEVTDAALTQVRADKQREAAAGFDGTWVAHPDLVPVARAEFDQVLGARPNQLDRQRPDVAVAAADLLAVDATPGAVTLEGVRADVDVALRYVSAWLTGTGAVAIHDLMEDAATAEIARAQLWQWIRHGVATAEGETVDAALVRGIIEQELAARRAELGAAAYAAARFEDAREVLERTAMQATLPEFLTTIAYDRLQG